MGHRASSWLGVGYQGTSLDFQVNVKQVNPEPTSERGHDV